MSNIEAQKKRIEEFFSGVNVNGIRRNVEFHEAEGDRLDVTLVAKTDRGIIPSVQLSIPLDAPVSPQEAVIAEILATLVAPSQINDDGAVTLLEASKWTDSTVLALNRFHDHFLTQTETFVEGGNKVNVVKPSATALDRLCAAWIAWRTKHYTKPSEDNAGDGDSLGDLDDHAF